MLDIKVKYLADVDKIEEITNGDWIDLRCAVDVDLKKGDFYEIPLGVAMELPKGYEAWLTSRSSMCKKFGIVHVDDLGVIDNSYCGDNDQWFLPVMAVRDTVIKANTRICQFRLNKTMKSEYGEIRFRHVEKLGNPDRGGLGSTGEQEVNSGKEIGSID